MRLLALAVLLATGCTSATRNDEVHTLLKGYESQGFSGTVLVVKDGRVVLHEGYGLADRERGIRNDKDTLFEVGSINKIFTAAAILQLQARGALKTTDPLSKHLGEFPPEKASATIYHLSTHTGGLVPDGHDLGDGSSRDVFIENVKRAPRESVPGESYRYTNAGYSVLAAIIEKVSGIAYETYVRNLAREAGLRDIYFRGETLPRPMAKGYKGDPPQVSIPPNYRWGTRGAGGMITTVEDVYRWIRFLQRNDDMKEMWVERPSETYAWHVERDAKGRRFIHKGGGMQEYAAQILHYPDDRLVIIWASNNLQRRWRQDLNRGIPAAILD